MKFADEKKHFICKSTRSNLLPCFSLHMHTITFLLTDPSKMAPLLLPVLSLLQDLHWVQPTRFLNGSDAVLLLVQHHGRRERGLARRLCLRRHDRGGSGRHGRGCGGGSARRLRWDQLLGSVGGGGSVHHWSWNGNARWHFF